MTAAFANAVFDDTRGAVEVWNERLSASKRIELKTMDVDGVLWLEARAEAGSARYVPHLNALVRNFTFAVGSLCIVDGVLYARQTVPLEISSLDANILLTSLAELCITAERLNQSK